MSGCCGDSAATDERKKDQNYKKGMQTIVCCNANPGNVCWTFYEMFHGGSKSTDYVYSNKPLLIMVIMSVVFFFNLLLGLRQN